jgi:hypothetical protein
VSASGRVGVNGESKAPEKPKLQVISGAFPPQVDGLAAPLRGAALRANTTSSGTDDLGAAAMRATHADIHILQGLAHPVGMRLR